MEAATVEAATEEAATAAALQAASCEPEGSSERACSVSVHYHRRHGHNLAFSMRGDGYLEPLLRAHLAPLRAAPEGTGGVYSVESVVASDNAGGLASADMIGGLRPALSAEERMEKTRKANAGESLWLARELR